MKKAILIVCLCALCCLGILLTVHYFTDAAPIFLSLPGESLFPVSGRKYDDIFLRATQTDGAYADAAAIQMRKLFEKDTDTFLATLSDQNKETKYTVVLLLAGEYCYAEKDMLWLQDQADSLLQDNELQPAELSLVQDIKDRAADLWEYNHST